MSRVVRGLGTSALALALWVGPAAAQEVPGGEAPPAEPPDAEAPEAGAGSGEAAPEAPPESVPGAAPDAEAEAGAPAEDVPAEPEAPVAVPAVPDRVAPQVATPVPMPPYEGPQPVLPVEPPPGPEPAYEPVEPAAPAGRRLLRYAVSLEAGTLQNSDPNYDLFASGNVMGSIGLSGGVRLARNLAVVGSWQRAHRGADVTVLVQDDDADFESSNQSLRAALLAHQVSVGVRVDVGIAEYLRPYVSGQGLAVLTRVRLDDDPEVRDNPGQVEAIGVATGGLVTFGAELRAPMSEVIHPAVYLEMGPSWLTVADLGELGAMEMGGFTLRTGIGVRF